MAPEGAISLGVADYRTVSNNDRAWAWQNSGS